MKILVDENIPSITVDELRAAGHDVRDIRGTRDEGMDDDKLWALTQHEKRMLITTDKGFARYRGQSHHGILVIRLKQPNEQRIHNRIMSAITKIQSAEWRGTLVVMRDVAQSIYRAP